MEVADLTGCRGGNGKRPAAHTDDILDARNQKRVKDEAAFGKFPGKAALSSRAKRAFEDCEGNERQQFCHYPQAGGAVGEATGEGGRPDLPAGRGDVHRVLQSSELENSIASICGALRWRSPVKPYKLPRLHAPTRLPGAPTAVRGIVDVAGSDGEDDLGHEHQQRRTTGGGDSCASENQQQQQLAPAAPPPPQQQQRAAQGFTQPHGASAAAQQRHQQHHEWGKLFSVLSLGAPGCGSQRTDPVWAAASSNRNTGGGGYSGGDSTRSWGAAARGAVPGPSQLQGSGQTSGIGASGGAQAKPGMGHSRGGGSGNHASSCQPNPSTADGSVRAAAVAVPAATPAGPPPPEGMDAEESGLGAVPHASAPAYGPIMTGPAVCEAMEASPARGKGTEVHQPLAPVEAASAELSVSRRAPGSGGVGAGGGFLAREAWRLLSGSSRDACRT